ncbi:IDEAL domain-containing protein [Paenibacillus odorifer]|uniref:IDEAL domain-containing protein n=1 Tax=Paenibacillus odorifer TaxID=189426 RepID=UPI002DBB0600|nr:IDEAL domain-containing protein [Paenibacillus odorifer]MEC0131510.1 IDEAL domain-containing protein [Paenibacillus odorifer]MEC0220337.1 IDEAL domain-containing protein [Paenibacillus odorifer]
MIFAVYALAIDKYIEVVWETAVRKHRIAELRTLIDQALDERDKESFYRYSTELNRLRNGG